MKNLAWGKLGPNWEGLYWVTFVTEVGAYRLEDLDEILVPQLQSVNILRKYYYQCKGLCMVTFIYITLMYAPNFSLTLYVDQNPNCGFKVNVLMVKQNLDQVRFLRLPALGKLMPNLSKG